MAQFPWQQHGHSVDELPVGGDIHEVTVAVHLPYRREEPVDGRLRVDDQPATLVVDVREELRAPAPPDRVLEPRLTAVAM